MKMEPTKPQHEPKKAEAIEKDQASVDHAVNQGNTPLREDYAKRAGAKAPEEAGNAKGDDHAARKA